MPAFPASAPPPAARGGSCFADLAAREEQLGEADAAHAAAFRQQRLEVFADHQLGGSAADVDHQLAAFLRLSVLHAHEDQARFFLTGDDFDRVGDHFGGALEEHFGVHRLTQGVRPDDGDVIRRKPCSRSANRASRRAALYRLFTEYVVAVQSVGEMHPLF